MKNKKILLFILCLPLLLVLPCATQGQGIDIISGGNITVTGAATIEINNGNFINNGNYTKGTETFTMSGTTPRTISGSSNTTMNDVVISNTGGITTQVGLLTTNNLSIALGSKLTVDPSKAVTTMGTTTLASTGCLLLKSTAAGTASFIDNGTISGAGSMKAERYLAKYNASKDYMFHFLSSPVVSQAIQNEFVSLPNTTNDFYSWGETTNTWINTKLANGTWNTGFESNFNSGKGYLVAYPADVTKNFVGVPYTNSSGLTVNCTNTAGKGNGWNLVGNPFPSPIDWDLVKTHSTNMDDALYYYDNATSNYRYYIPFSGGLGGSGGIRYIPAMQGFMVHANSAVGAHTVNMKNTDRVHSGLNTYYKSEIMASNILDLKVEGNGYSDYARVCFYDDASRDFDSEYDAYKLWSYNTKVPQIYTVTEANTLLAINTLPVSVLEGGSIPVSFKASMDGSFSITAEQLNTFSPDTYITLEDKLTGKSQRLSNNAVYSFTATPQDATDRFTLHFLDATSVADTKPVKDFSVYASDGILNIKSLNQLGGKILVTDMAGRTIATGRIEAGATTQINIHGNTGVYIVSVLSGKGRSNTKVIVK